MHSVISATNQHREWVLRGIFDKGTDHWAVSASSSGTSRITGTTATGPPEIPAAATVDADYCAYGTVGADPLDRGTDA